MKLSIEQWEEVGKGFKQTNKQLWKWNEILWQIPPSFWLQDFSSIIKGFNKLVNNLENRLFMQHRDQGLDKLVQVLRGGIED